MRSPLWGRKYDVTIVATTTIAIHAEIALDQKTD